jgi:hypothetical protein
MPGRAAQVILTQRQQHVLHFLTRSRTCPQALAFDGWDNEDIAQRLGYERHQVGLWRRRYEEEGTLTACVDEMTGTQARDRLVPTKPTKPGRVDGD